MSDVTVSAITTTTVSTTEAVAPAPASTSPTVQVWQSYKVGGCDSKGRRIKLIYSHLDSHVIYEAEGTLQIEGKTESLESSSDVNNLLAEILSITPGSERSKRLVFYQLAVALDTCMAGDCRGAVRILKNISARARRLRILKGQLCYLWGCIGVAAFTLSISLIAAVNAGGMRASFRSLIIMAGLGSLGGVLSVAVGLRKIDVDAESGVLFNCSAGAVRTIIACIGAVFVHFAITGNILFGAIGQGQGGGALYALAMLAGFSETLIPNSLRRLESSTANPTAQTDGSAAA